MGSRACACASDAGAGAAGTEQSCRIAPRAARAGVVALPASEHSFCSKLISKGRIECVALRDTDLHREVASLRASSPTSGAEGGHLRVFHISASPGTCVNIALHAASIAADCDFVISGPNVGHNAGRSNLMSSGTVGAAMEAAIARRRAVALSFPFFDGWNGWTREQIDEAASISGDVVADLWTNWAAVRARARAMPAARGRRLRAGQWRPIRWLTRSPLPTAPVASGATPRRTRPTPRAGAWTCTM